jgi:hypothetical protein
MTEGDHGRISFRYNDPTYLISFRDDMDDPVLMGGTARILMDSDGPGHDEGVRAESDDISIAIFELERDCKCSDDDDESPIVDDDEGACDEGFTLQCRNTITMTAVSVGKTKLNVVESDGSLIDSVAVHVGDAAKIVILDESGNEVAPSDSFRLFVVKPEYLEAEVYDQKDRRMLGRDAVEWSVPDNEYLRLRGSVGCAVRSQVERYCTDGDLSTCPPCKEDSIDFESLAGCDIEESCDGDDVDSCPPCEPIFDDRDYDVLLTGMQQGTTELTVKAGTLERVIEIRVVN